MSLVHWFEKKAGWIAFPGIIRYLAIFQLLVLGLSFVNPGLNSLLQFDWEALKQGEIWRGVTFLFIPLGSLQGGGVMAAVFGFFAAMLLMRFSDGLEERWGVLGTTLFFGAGWIVSLAISILYAAMMVPAYQILSPGFLFDLAILFAFATYYPKFELRLFFFLPVPIFLIALLSALSLLIRSLSIHPLVLGYVIACLSHYLAVIVPLLGRRYKGVSKSVRKEAPRRSALHHCTQCAVTDQTHPERFFRVLPTGQEVCNVCLEEKN